MPLQQQEPIHLGRKIESIRNLKGIKQETLAKALGISRQGYAKMEKNEKVDKDKLDIIAETLGVPAEAIKNFNENAIINNNIYDQNNTVINYNINAIEKIVELYDALLKSEREKIALLESLLNNKK
ncbi:MAG: helix-turn-helix transcriptional regulator [Candidatus Pedobacter colombiensis]|uniref:Helix-turn-helix transcriptional regulator n=1 Tax=Candidatus Pedobacter colombiensis TaxID=3121371 RepID=A0AAJ6B5X7_9SPHI|nr:helix-turn-helix transcriptional regulator [Pedobacter sp.]WEK17956.1 MAG: helix-turn-helix transcriptional regulator [Pedobacter sp.]